MEIIVHNLNESFLPAIACTRRLLTSHRIWCLRNFQRNYRSELMDKHKAQVRVRTYVHANVPRLDWGSCPFEGATIRSQIVKIVKRRHEICILFVRVFWHNSWEREREGKVLMWPINAYSKTTLGYVMLRIFVCEHVCTRVYMCAMLSLYTRFGNAWAWPAAIVGREEQLLGGPPSRIHEA